MISAIRNKFGSRLLDIFIWVAIVAFILLYIVPGGRGAKQKEPWAIDVDGEVGTYREFNNILEMSRKNVQSLKDLSGRQKEEKARKDAVEALTRVLLIQKLEKDMNIQIEPSMITAKMLKMLPGGAVGEDGKVSVDFLKKIVGEEYLEVLEKEVSKELRAEIVNYALIGGLYIPNFMQDNYYRSEYAAKKFSILTISYKDVLSKIENEKISDKELKAFFDKENKTSGRYMTKESRSGEVWTFLPENFNIKVSEKQVKNYYNKNRKTEFVKEKPKIQIRRILIEVDKSKDKDGSQLAGAQEKAGRIRAELAGDASKFEALAKEHSDDKQSASKGGLLDFFAEGERDKKLVDAAFELRSDGEISEIIETDRGVEILQRVAKKSAKYKSLEGVSELIKKKLTKQKFQKLFAINARRIIARSVKNPSEFEKFVEAKKAKKTNLKNIVEAKGADTRKLFGLKKVNSKGFLFDKGNGQIVVLTELDKSVDKDFDKIKSEVLLDLRKEKAVKLIKADLKKAESAVDSGKDMKAIAEKMGADFEQTGLLSKDNFGKLDKLRKKGIPANSLWKLGMEGATGIEVNTDSNIPNGYLVKLDLMQKSTKEDFKSKKRGIFRALFTKYRPTLDATFIASLAKSAKIKKNTALVNV